MDHEQPFDASPIPSSALHPESETGHTFDLSTPVCNTPGPFSDLPLYIPGMTIPEVGFDVAVNVAALTAYPENGLLCILQPYLAMAELDFIELFCQDLFTPVAAHTVSREQAEQGLQIPLYISPASLLDGTLESVFFRLTRSSGDTDETRHFRLKLDNLARTDLASPHVDQASDGVIQPAQCLFVTLRIDPYIGQQPFDRITLVLCGNHANGVPYYREFDDVAGKGSIIFRLENGVRGDIARLEGGTLRFYYIVSSAQGPRVSQDLLLEVGRPQASSMNADKLSLQVQALSGSASNLLGIPHGGTLDLGSFEGNAMLALAKWPLSTTGQLVWIICSNSTVGDLWVLGAYAITSAEALYGLANKPVLRSWLETIPDGGQIQVRCQVAFDGSQSPEAVVTFPTTTYTVVQRKKLYQLWDFDDRTFQGWVPQGNYANGNLSPASGSVATYTNGEVSYFGHVMTRTVNVRANSSYDLGFSVTAISNTDRYGSMLQLTMNGVGIGGVVNTENQVVWRTGTGFFTSSITGTVTIGFYNHVADDRGNDFAIDSVWIKER